METPADSPILEAAEADLRQAQFQALLGDGSGWGISLDNIEILGANSPIISVPSVIDSSMPMIQKIAFAGVREIADADTDIARNVTRPRDGSKNGTAAAAVAIVAATAV